MRPFVRGGPHLLFAFLLVGVLLVPAFLSGTVAAADLSTGLFLAYDMQNRLDMTNRITGLTFTQTVNGSSVPGSSSFTQGVAFDGFHYYSNRLTLGHFYVTKYDLAFNEIASHDATNDGPIGTTQINSVFIYGQTLYYGANNYPTSPAESWIFMYDKTTLKFLGLHALSGPSTSSFWGEGTCFASNAWWAVGNAVNPMVVWKYDTSWNFQTSYSFNVPLASGAAGPPPGYLSAQGCRWDQGLFYITIHDLVPGTGYLHAFKLVGSRMQYVMAIKASVAGTDCCGQGFEIRGNKAYFAYRTPYYGLKIATITRGGLNAGPMDDLSGNGWYGNITWTSLENGRFDAATRFSSKNDGTNTTPDTIEVLPSSDWQGWSSISVSTWLRTSYQGDQAIAGVFAGGTNGEWLLSTLTTSSEVRWTVVNDASTRVDVFYVYPAYHDGTWHQIGGTWDGSTARLWINGVNVANGSLSGHLKSYSTPFYIGRYSPTTGGFYLNGSVDQTVIYKNRVIGSTEMLQLASETGTDLFPEGVVVPPSAQDVFGGILGLVSPFFGGSTDAAGIILSVVVIVLLAALVTLAAPRLVEGPGILIPVGVGVVLTAAIGWLPMWGVVTIAFFMLFVMLDPLGMKKGASGGGGSGA